MFNYGNANEAQKEAISATDGLVLITAGPGTGKTFTLVKRAVYLIQECGIKPEQIMMATFTEKAAKELITRITNELAERNVSVNVNEMYIGTFHSLCLRIIKENLEFTRLKRNYRLLDTLGLSEKETNIDSMKEQERFSEFSLTAEISRYMNISCLTIAKILRESVDGSGNIVAAVNRHNEILEDVIIPEIFHTLYEVKSTQKSEDVDMVLLREPKDSGYYEFSANDELVITKGHNNFTPKEEAKSFHADTYCFDSKPEKECFLQYISSNKVKEIYFTGMFTSNQGDLSVQYYDPESKRLRKYYPDFLALMEDGSYQLIEVKGDNKIDDEVVLAKKAAAEEMAVASGVHYLMYAGSTLMKSNVLEPTLAVQQTSIDI